MVLCLSSHLKSYHENYLMKIIPVIQIKGLWGILISWLLPDLWASPGQRKILDSYGVKVQKMLLHPLQVFDTDLCMPPFFYLDLAHSCMYIRGDK